MDVRSYLAMALVLAVCSAASADTLVLKDGRSFEGYVQNQDELTVVFKVIKGGMKATTSFGAAEVQEIRKGPVVAATPQTKPAEPKEEKQTGPTYFVIPIKGTFGLEITDEVLSKSLEVAAKAQPTVVLFEIDSYGGYTEELAKMLRTLTRYPDLRFAAYVDQAGSCAALFSMACKEIVISPTGIMGACVVYQNGPGKTPKNITAKLESFERARFRASAAAAGHDPLLIEGMMRTDIALSVKEADGKTKIVEGTGGKVLKRKGAVLTLAGKEAVDCGLAVGAAPAIEKANEALGLSEWRELSSKGKVLWSLRDKELKQAVVNFEGSRKRALDKWSEAQTLGTDREPTRKQLLCLKESARSLEMAIELTRRYPRLLADSRVGQMQGAGQVRSPQDVQKLERLRSTVDGKIRTVEAALPDQQRSRIVLPASPRPTFGKDRR